MKRLDRFSWASTGVMAGLDPTQAMARTRASLPWIAASRARLSGLFY